MTNGSKPTTNHKRPERWRATKARAAIELRGPLEAIRSNDESRG